MLVGQAFDRNIALRGPDQGSGGETQCEVRGGEGRGDGIVCVDSSWKVDC